MPLINQVRPLIELPTALEHRWQTLRLLEARIEEALSRALQTEHQLSVTEYAALAALGFSDDGGHLRQQFLADSIPLNQSSVSRLVGRLEKLGLTERYLCPQDRRGVYTQISDKGRERLAAARETWVRVLREALGQAAEDPELAPAAVWLSEEAGLSQSR
ncbi:MarR family winged helix-turn-helix transcriptional regulator [Actinacidiphila sp. ITFR-21]|uniref:MarR family winged helix-turn-helix transcriptional regulator n=1 Tax=Actinacidiphila sp. ITFR-21 TaxID=3075199 RepID=UPI00288AA643|nr:MarR family transcriptional regulator [Streptomyces sp. ITFR-21]WNI18812.1 MarR family transcriptional regulator [Streptomyces sp. ITFR-21]